MRLRAMTSRFEGIEVEEANIITLTQGLIGFPTLHKYAMLEYNKGMPFHWFQCLDDSSLAFVIINPLIFRPEYKVKISREETADLKINNPAMVTAYAIITIPSDPAKMTANLQAPILINNENKLGKQVILINSEYSTKHVVLEELQKTGERRAPKNDETITYCSTFDPS